ncbi:alpha-galactosidase [Agromyces sp. SYSU T0242]|uniref:alpha-galactosidase n=1 Tax=Agromyces litoreus TaxID=3158561 RepID=UPI00339191C3
MLHWGADAGAEFPHAAAFTGPTAFSAYDEPIGAELVPQASSGWRGRPGVSGSRSDGTAFSPRLRLRDHRREDEDGVQRLTLDLDDPVERLGLIVQLELHPTGILRMRSTLINGGDDDYRLEALMATLPVAAEAREILDLTGRWCREQHPQRNAIQHGTWAREYRHGRTGHDASVLTAVGTPGFANRSGEVWATHFGFSGNRVTTVEATPGGPTRIGSSELFQPGELRIAAGSAHTTPWAYFAYSDRGLDGVSDAFHAWMRARPQHPRSPRPVVVNTWEAVYFDHDLDGLIALADRAAEVGAERFVLDDGWFLGRRDDASSLGDWDVDGDVWPEGLGPLIDAVRERGMEFGLWVEPEMISEDSELCREHPDWISRPGEHAPARWRDQQVLDLTNPEAWQHVYDKLDALLAANDIRYLKWDQNRDQVEMGSRGRASTHRQTLAAYRLIDRLRRAHPTVEIESCSSGGARVDLGILERTDRVWASDCNDALERQTIQRWTQAVVPPELVGSHIGPPTSHTTLRTHDLGFRGITALFGHLGLEWDLRALDEQELGDVRALVDLYKRYRGLLHAGRTVNADVADPAFSLRGVVAQDRAAAVFGFVALATSREELPGRVRLPGLDPDARYRVELVHPTSERSTIQRRDVGWSELGVTATGAVLGRVGLPMPALAPEHGVLVDVRAQG